MVSFICMYLFYSRHTVNAIPNILTDTHFGMSGDRWYSEHNLLQSLNRYGKLYSLPTELGSAAVA